MESQIPAPTTNHWGHTMKLSIALTSLFLATCTALPAFAAMPASISPREAAAAPVQTVQYQQTHHAHYNAGRHQATRGWPCVSGSRVDSDANSAFPNWEVGCR